MLALFAIPAFVFLCVGIVSALPQRRVLPLGPYAEVTQLSIVAAAAMIILAGICLYRHVARTIGGAWRPDHFGALRVPKLTLGIALVAAMMVIGQGIPNLAAMVASGPPQSIIPTVLADDIYCGYGARGISVGAEGIGGTDGHRLCALPRDVALGLDPGDVLVARGFFGPWAFHAHEISLP